MSFEDYKKKEHVMLVYTGEGKGKTSASIGLMCRALGTELSVAFIQFIKHWEVGEHRFIAQISDVYKDKLLFFKGGEGFYNAGDISAKNVTDDQHKEAAQKTFDVAMDSVMNGRYDVVICDEINNAVHDGLLTVEQLKDLIEASKGKASLCLTGRDFPEELNALTDIATNMTKIKHHFDDEFLANKGIDF